MSKPSGDSSQIKTIFSENVTKFMEAQGLTAQAICRKSGVSPSFMSDIVNRRANPSLETMEQIAQALNVPLHVLLLKNEWLRYIVSRDKNQTTKLK